MKFLAIDFETADYGRDSACALGLVPLASSGRAAEPTARPNIVFIFADDWGWGDLSCHGHPYVKTPNIDALHGESVRLTNYHVSPTCAPTRSALLTGRYSNLVGPWHTIQGRSILHHDEITMAEEAMAQAAGVLMMRRMSTEGKTALFMSCDKVKFRRAVRPGDQLMVHVKMTKSRGNKIGMAEGECTVNGQVTSSAELMFALVDVYSESPSFDTVSTQVPMLEASTMLVSALYVQPVAVPV